MEKITQFFEFLLNSEEIIRYGGLLLVSLIVYAENGLFFAFFLPGDYLLFLAGLFCSTGQLAFPIAVVSGVIILAAITGSFTGYIFGRFLGNNLEDRPDSFFFKRKNLEQSRAFFEKHGGKALVLARFMPIIRTFSPIIAGTIKMRPGIFTFYNVAGAMAWGLSLPLLGYFLGRRFPQIIDYVEYIIIFFLAITSIAVIRTFVSMRQQAKEEAEDSVKL